MLPEIEKICGGMELMVYSFIKNKNSPLSQIQLDQLHERISGAPDPVEIQPSVRELARRGTAALTTMRGKHKAALQLSFDSSHHCLSDSFNKFLFNKWTVLLLIFGEFVRMGLWGMVEGQGDKSLFLYWIYCFSYRLLLYAPVVVLWCLSFNTDVFKMIAHTFELREYTYISSVYSGNN